MKRFVLQLKSKDLRHTWKGSEMLMAGHSKWANIKHKKARADAAKGKMFTKASKEITVAAREGGSDPDTNVRLRTAIQDARNINMPNDNVDRAIKRGTGDLEGMSYEEVSYEGYGPGGVAIMLNIITDNRNRTASEIRHIFTRHGGNLGEAGCVGWMFEKKGVVVVKDSDNITEDEIMMHALEAGAEDVKSDDGVYEILTQPSDFEDVRDHLLQEEIELESSSVTMIPNNTTRVEGRDAQRLIDLLDALEEHDDVQDVHANYDIPDEILANN